MCALLSGFTGRMPCRPRNGGSVTRWPLCSDAFECFQPAGFDCPDELVVVAFVLLGVPLGEVSDRFVERIAVAEIGGDGDRIPGTGMSSGKGPPANASVVRQRDWCHRLDQR